MNQVPLASASQRIALTRLDVIVAVGTLAILLTLAAVFLSRGPISRELPPRAVCAANLKGMGTGMYTYANENNNMWPTCASTQLIDEGRLHVTYAPGLIGKSRDVSDEALANQAKGGELKTSVTRDMWVLIREQMSTQKSFICPVSTDVPNEDEEPQKLWDFGKYTEISYGLQIPFGRYGRPSVDCDQRMPLAADKGPYSAALEAGMTNPGIPKADHNSKIKTWRSWNSPNHNGDGQNTLFADGHVDWDAKPIIGIENDNIYTRWSTPTADFVPNHDDPLPRIHGTPPTSDETPMSNSDTLIYP